MFSILHRNNKLKKCHHDILPLIKEKKRFNDTIDINKFRGDIPESCTQKEFNDLLEHLEVSSFIDKRDEPLIRKYILSYNSEKLYKLKQKLEQ